MGFSLPIPHLPTPLLANSAYFYTLLLLALENCRHFVRLKLANKTLQQWTRTTNIICLTVSRRLGEQRLFSVEAHSFIMTLDRLALPHMCYIVHHHALVDTTN